MYLCASNPLPKNRPILSLQRQHVGCPVVELERQSSAGDSSPLSEPRRCLLDCSATFHTAIFTTLGKKLRQQAATGNWQLTGAALVRGPWSQGGSGRRRQNAKVCRSWCRACLRCMMPAHEAGPAERPRHRTQQKPGRSPDVQADTQRLRCVRCRRHHEPHTPARPRHAVLCSAAMR